MKFLQFTIATGKLQEMGYTFQKLYARDYKTYRKKINDWTIWLWVQERRLEIDDWFHYTGPIIDFYKKNLEANQELPYMKEVKRRRPESIAHEYMKLFVHEETCEVIFYDMDGYMEAMSQKDFMKASEAFEKKYEGYRKIVIHIPTFNNVLAEIETLTK